ncbi:ORF30 [Human alphaherpesvirus 3]|nr:ORF30 [Human alphaherpesvirus 3]
MELDINRTLLVLLGQVYTYIFQVELLRRCDPRVACRFLYRLAANCLTVRYLLKLFLRGFNTQLKFGNTPTVCALHWALCYVKGEGERLFELLQHFKTRFVYGETKDSNCIKDYFVSAFNLKTCQYHHELSLTTYGGYVSSEIQFLHDIENFLKQLNYCYIITSSREALNTLETVTRFMTDTIGSGLIPPVELFDPAHLCAICFEELCITANQGETLHRRLLGCICDHVTKQVRVNVDVDDIIRCLPYIPDVPDIKRQSAVEALRTLQTKTVVNPMGAKNDTFDQTYEIASTMLDSYNVFKPAPRCMYAISELKFWLTSNSTEGPQRTLDVFVDNLDVLNEHEKHAELTAVTVELALFGKTPIHFDRAFSEELGSLDAIDSILVGNRSSSPDSQIEALIKACYAHHLSSPLMRHISNPSHDNEAALRQLLERVGCEDDLTKEASDSATASECDLNDDSSITFAVHGWENLLSKAKIDAAERKRVYLEHLSKRSLTSLGRCIREQRQELEKTLRVNVYGEALLQTFVSMQNGFGARNVFLAKVSQAGCIIDNRIQEAAFDAHRFIRNTLVRHTVDAAMLPALTHKFFELVNGPLFNHDEHRFAQPPNTALFFTVENVGLFPHLKEELAKFMGGVVGSNWLLSPFRGFYCFSGVEGVTFAQRLAWKYIRELVFATTLFTSVFHCGEVRLCRVDRLGKDPRGCTSQPKGIGSSHGPLDGIYLTYEETCPLVAIIQSGETGIDQNTVVIYDSDVFSLLYTLMQRLAPDSTDPAFS